MSMNVLNSSLNSGAGNVRANTVRTVATSNNGQKPDFSSFISLMGNGNDAGSPTIPKLGQTDPAKR